MNEFNEMVDVCLKKSFLLRLRKSDSKWLLHIAAGYLPFMPQEMSKETYKLIESNLRELLVRDIRKRYGNPVIIFILLRIIMPIVIRLIIEWWSNHYEAQEWIVAKY